MVNMMSWKILTLAVLSVEANHEIVYKREIVQYDDGLFYHEGPYVSHNQYERQARFVDSRPSPVLNTIYPQQPNLYQNSYLQQPQQNYPYQNNYQPQEPFVNIGYPLQHSINSNYYEPQQQYESSSYYEPQQQYENDYFQPQHVPNNYNYKHPAISFEDQNEDKGFLREAAPRLHLPRQRLSKPS